MNDYSKIKLQCSFCLHDTPLNKSFIGDHVIFCKKCLKIWSDVNEQTRGKNTKYADN